MKKVILGLTVLFASKLSFAEPYSFEIESHEVQGEEKCVPSGYDGETISNGKILVDTAQLKLDQWKKQVGISENFYYHTVALKEVCYKEINGHPTRLTSMNVILFHKNHLVTRARLTYKYAMSDVLLNMESVLLGGSKALVELADRAELEFTNLDDSDL